VRRRSAFELEDEVIDEDEEEDAYGNEDEDEHEESDEDEDEEEATTNPGIGFPHTARCNDEEDVDSRK
jgi:hypothetical protein